MTFFEPNLILILPFPCVLIFFSFPATGWNSMQFQGEDCLNKRLPFTSFSFRYDQFPYTPLLFIVGLIKKCSERREKAILPPQVRLKGDKVCNTYLNVLPRWQPVGKVFGFRSEVSLSSFEKSTTKISLFCSDSLHRGRKAIAFHSLGLGTDTWSFWTDIQCWSVVVCTWSKKRKCGRWMKMAVE